MKKQISYLPASARRYSVSSEGDVFDEDGVLLKTETGEYGPVVELVCVCGCQKYSVELLVLITFNGWFVCNVLRKRR